MHDFEHSRLLNLLSAIGITGVGTGNQLERLGLLNPTCCLIRSLFPLLIGQYPVDERAEPGPSDTHPWTIGRTVDAFLDICLRVHIEWEDGEMLTCIIHDWLASLDDTAAAAHFLDLIIRSYSLGPIREIMFPTLYSSSFLAALKSSRQCWNTAYRSGATDVADRLTDGLLVKIRNGHEVDMKAGGPWHDLCYSGSLTSSKQASKSASRTPCPPAGRDKA
ncbi:MAG: hypothetical protein AAF823_10285 [Planctomycetota bacterium]